MKIELLPFLVMDKCSSFFLHLCKVFVGTKIFLSSTCLSTMFKLFLGSVDRMTSLNYSLYDIHSLSFFFVSFFCIFYILYVLFLSSLNEHQNVNTRQNVLVSFSVIEGKNHLFVHCLLPCTRQAAVLLVIRICARLPVCYHP